MERMMAWRRRCRRFETALHRCPKLPQRPLLRGAFCSAQGTVALYILDTQKGSCMFLHFPIWGDKNLRQGSHDKLPTHVTSCLSRVSYRKETRLAAFTSNADQACIGFLPGLIREWYIRIQSLRWPGQVTRTTQFKKVWPRNSRRLYKQLQDITGV